MTNNINETKQLSLSVHLYRYLLRLLLVIYSLLALIAKIVPKRSAVKGPLKIVATGTFYSDHWLITHLRPMANAQRCTELIMVAADKVPEMHNVKGVYAPAWLQKITGKVGSRLIFFIWIVIKERPDAIVGFHLLLNGLLVALIARVFRAKSIYICGGGPREVKGGGYTTENRIFSRIQAPDLFIEQQLLNAVNNMDLVISMGTSAVTYFQSKGVNTRFEIVPGGFDNQLFCAKPEIEKKYDLILIGRLSEIKRVDRFLQAIKLAKSDYPQLNAVIVGDGPDIAELKKQALDLEIAEDIHFAGWQNNVHEWLQASRCFVLTSDSEGLSQALIQGMMCGLPAITSNVGDLGDLVKANENGYLIDSLSAENFSNAFVSVFKDDNCKTFSNEALAHTKKYAVDAVTAQWNDVFSNFNKLNQMKS